MPEAVCPVFEAKLSAPDLILFYVKILARSKLLNRNRTADVLRAVGLLLGRRVKRCDLDSLFNMKLARLSVRTKSAVVVYSVCYVGTLLYLSDEDTLAYRMESSGLYEENVTSFSAAIFGDGFFEEEEESDTAIETPAAVPAAENNTNNNKADEPADDKSSQQPEGGSFTVKI